MVDYGFKIASLKSEQARLSRREIELAAQRREEIGKLAERFGALEADDEVLAGLFVELKSAMESDSPRLAQWRDAGARFRSAQSPRHGANAAPNPNRADKA
jgi:hypothetical protein